MAERVFKLTFNGPFYVGTLGIDREETLIYIPSDTLFGALVVAWSMLGQRQILDALPGYADQPATFPFRLTSVFPYAGSVRFFPRPQQYLPQLTQSIDPKRYKKADWVSETIFNQLRRSQIPAEYDTTVNFIQGKNVWLTRQERKQITTELNLPDAPDDPDTDLYLWGHAVVPRVTVDRQDNASNLFHSGRVTFVVGSGLWFAARGEQLEWVETGLTYLQDAGLGGLRGTGHGAFKFQPWVDVPHLPKPDHDDYFINLARFAPTQTEIATTLRQPNAAYKLTIVGGWCQDDAVHPWRRKRVRLVTEGACLGWNKQINGQLVDVTPVTSAAKFNERKVYRYGLTFPVSTR